jgi:predicted GNAT superfamily acetyltransferase
VTEAAHPARDDALADIEIRTLSTAGDLRLLVTLFNQVWGTVTPLVGVELLRAIEHAGGYTAAAFHGEQVIGGSLGFLARHEGAPALHSHVTGILPGVRHTGLGRAMKQHQRRWAADHGLDWVTWTFDPLVRRNAWFNIDVLRAEVHQYLVDFYGPIDDAINLADESDRLLVAWPTTGELDDPRARAGEATIRVATPEDIVVLRRTDPAAAGEWRHRVRRELGDRLAAGAEVVGFTRDGQYLLAT